MDKFREKLFNLQDEKYALFLAPLIPNIDKNTIIGVRSPAMKKLIKELKGDQDIELFIKTLPHNYYEENILHASLISSISKDIDKIFEYIDAFLPYVDNWAVCDSMVASLKIFSIYLQKVKIKVMKYLNSEKPFTVRFALVTLLSYFLDDNFDKESINTLSKIDSQDYYVNMALAWYYSFALIKQYDSFIGLFEKKTLPKFVQNKAIQKSVESYRIASGTKDYLKSLKI